MISFLLIYLGIIFLVKAMFLFSVPVMEIQTDNILVVKNKGFIVITQLCSGFVSMIY